MKLYRAALILVVVLWGVVSFYYHTGSAGVRFGGVAGGATIDFHRGSDYQLYRIADHLALEVDRSGSFAVVDYLGATPPMTLLCGRFENHGTALDGVRVSGDWVYGRPVEQLREQGWHKVYRAGVAAVNLKTGEQISVAKLPGDPLKDAALPPELIARGLTEESGTLINASFATRLSSLSTTNEGCETFNWAFVILLTGMALALPLLLLFRRRTA